VTTFFVDNFGGQLQGGCQKSNRPDLWILASDFLGQFLLSTLRGDPRGSHPQPPYQTTGEMRGSP